MSDKKFHDEDPIETQEWRDALDSVLEEEGSERAQVILKNVLDHASQKGISTPLTTSYINTIPVSAQASYPGNEVLEHKISALNRWNAMAMVVRAGKYASELGGHIATYASAATLYEVGFNHFFRAPSDKHEGDLIYYQGHSSPGIYARSFLEGRLTEDQLAHFRQEVEVDGLSSYPHPWLMPDYWQFPTVSMGLGPLTAIYQARFLKYLENRGLSKKSDRKVWAFLGDGEMVLAKIIVGCPLCLVAAS